MRVQQGGHRRRVDARMEVHRNVEIHNGLPEHVELRLVVENERLCGRRQSVEPWSYEAGVSPLSSIPDCW